MNDMIRFLQWMISLFCLVIVLFLEDIWQIENVLFCCLQTYYTDHCRAILFFTQHVLEPTRGENILDISSQQELVDNVKIHEPLGNSDHNQIHFDINVKYIYIYIYIYIYHLQ